MTVINWIEAKEHASLVASRLGKREWTAPYILEHDDPRAGAQECVDFMDSIGRGLSSGYRYGDWQDPLKLCKQMSVSRIPGSAVHWQLISTYSDLEPRDGEDEDGNPSDNPIDWRYEISTGTQYYQVPVYKAWNMDVMPLGGSGGGYKRPVETLGPVHNSAGTVYDPPLTRDIAETVLRISGNALEYVEAVLQYTVGTINQFELHWSDRLTERYGFKVQYFRPCCVLCSSAGVDYRVDNDIRYWRYTFEFRMRRPADALNPQDGFLETILDRGLNRLAMAGGPDGHGGTYSALDFHAGMPDVVAVRDVEDRRIPEMVMLDGHGQPLRGSDTLEAEPVYFRWRVHPYGVFQYPFLPLDIYA
jgi:hypothetical protein